MRSDSQGCEDAVSRSEAIYSFNPSAKLRPPGLLSKLELPCQSPRSNHLDFLCEDTTNCLFCY